MLLLYVQIFNQIYGRSGTYASQGCPFVGEVAVLMEMIGNFQTQHAVINETWLLFLHFCVKHKQCIHCFQEADEDGVKGMIWLRRKVIDAASKLISTVYETATAKDDFIAPLIACSRALISGCSIAVNITKRWVPARPYLKDLIKCTEILTLFASHWQGGHTYLNVWRVIIKQIDIDQGQIA
jgi:hypothetical protein